MPKRCIDRTQELCIAYAVTALCDQVQRAAQPCLNNHSLLILLWCAAAVVSYIGLLTSLI